MKGTNSVIVFKMFQTLRSSPERRASDGTVKNMVFLYLRLGRMDSLESMIA